ncbi:hypothetical protein [Bacterioplanoides sp.]|uniref:hypothetical protein n=1 Tax=Bacterioplanoides sp. TaxID=2066072 RepID=UPI003B008634
MVLLSIFFSLLITVMKTNKLLAIAHDAGAANHILAWYLSGDLSDYDVAFCFYGPALKLAQEKGIPVANQSYDRLIPQFDVVLCGTGWATDIEKQAMRLASRLKITTVAVFDHWTNYSERLLLGGQPIAVSAIWVVDEDARTSASAAYPSISVVVKENRYLKGIAEEVSDWKTTSSDNVVLFIMEPLRHFSLGSEAAECHCFDFFMANLKKLSQFLIAPAQTNIIIRPHPSDDPGKYQPLIDRYSQHDIHIDNETSLTQQIAEAQLVVGMQSYALVIALAAGKRVVSSLPEEAPACILPHQDIIHLKDS